MKPKLFVITVLLFLVVITGLYFYLFNLQIGAKVNAEWWVRDIYEYKDYIAKKIDNPKIIIIGGSNAMFGINSSIIKRKIGYPVVNLSSHAGLDISFFYYKIKKYISPGDIVVMPLEFEFYQRSGYNDWFINNMLAWGEDSFLSELDTVALFRFIATVPIQRIGEGILKGEKMKNTKKSDIIKSLNEMLDKERTKWRGYNYLSLNKYGDITPGKLLKNKLKNNCSGYYIPDAISNWFLTFYYKIKKNVEDKGAFLILTWPVTIRNERFDLSIDKYQKKTEKFKKILSEKNIDILCNPALFNFDMKFFFDTIYHPNKFGAIIRSNNLSSCIQHVIIGDGQHEISYRKAIHIVKNEEKNISDIYSNYLH